MTAATSTPACPLVFVAGSSRSGTTMMGNILGTHARVFMFKELHFFERLWAEADRDRVLSHASASDLAARLFCTERDGILFQKDPQRFRSDASAMLASLPAGTGTAADVFRGFLEYETRQHGKDIACDQTPRNVFYIDDILQIYPDARVVLMVRDPRDVLASQKNKWTMRFRGLNHDPILEAIRLKVNYHPVTTSLLWRAAVEAAERWAGHERVHLVRFEDVIADPNAAVRGVCEFLALPFDTAMLEIRRVNSSYGDSSLDRRGIASDAAGRWRRGGLSPAEVYLCQRVTRESMVRHGYAADSIRPPRLAVALLLLVLPLKAAGALALNLSKMRNLPEAIRRRFGRRGA